MTTPGAGPPEDAFVLGSQYGQDITEESAKAIMKGGPIGAYSLAQNVHKTNVLDPISQLWNQIGASIVSALQGLAQLMVNVPFIGNTLSEIINNIANALNATVHRADQADAKAEVADTKAESAQQHSIAVQSVVLSPPSGRPFWDGIDPTGEATIPRINATATAIIDNLNARGGFIRASGGRTKDTVTWIGETSGTIPEFYVSLYRMRDNGDLEKIHESENIANILKAPRSWHQYVFPDGVSHLTEENEILAVDLKVFGTGTNTGTHTVMANPVATEILPLPGLRPQKTGYSRASVIPSPELVQDSSVHYTDTTPYIEAGSNLGLDLVPRLWTDDFNRPDGPMGHNWSLGSVHTSSQLQVRNRRANYRDLAEGTQMGLWIYQTATDHCRVHGAFVGLVNLHPSTMILCANSILSAWVGVEAFSGEVKIVTGGSFDAPTIRAQRSISLNASSQVIGLEYDPETTTFHVYTPAEATPILSWTDTNHEVMHGPGFRFGGLAIKRNFFVQSADVDDWKLWDVTTSQEGP